jgi:hypothetical protein
MPQFTLTPEVLGMIAGVILSLAFSYIPGLNAWFAAKDPTFKRLVMLLLLAISAGAIFALSCGAILTVITCDRAGVVQLVWIFILAVIANQSTFTISPQVVRPVTQGGPVTSDPAKPAWLPK